METATIEQIAANYSSANAVEDVLSEIKAYKIVAYEAEIDLHEQAQKNKIIKYKK